ncbi:MAG: hypothetical protein ABI678_14565 [Kofleriaceae bacterium]
MATQPECKHFNDIYEKPPKLNGDNPSSKKDHDAVVDRNNRNARIYRAVAVVLEKNFKTILPDKPEDFPGKLEDQDLAKASAILGLILADNWQDPSNGKTLANADDLPGKDGVIDRRFIDAVVDAVKEYTTASDLYNNVFKLMIAEAAEGPSAAPATSK